MQVRVVHNSCYGANAGTKTSMISQSLRWWWWYDTGGDDSGADDISFVLMFIGGLSTGVQVVNCTPGVPLTSSQI